MDERASASPAWGPVKRFFLRFGFVYFLLLMVPFDVSVLPFGRTVIRPYEALWEWVGPRVGRQVFGVNVEIVESGSVSQASRQLYVAQPSLSQQMGKLEDEVGKRLLVRSVRGVTPTANGEALYHHAKLVLRQLDEAVQVARQEFKGIRARVSFGIAPSSGSTSARTSAPAGDTA